MNLGKHYIPSSHWVVVCISDYEYAEYFDSYGFHPTSSKSMHNCNANQYLAHSTATGYRVSLRMSAVTTAASTPSKEPWEKWWRHSCTCLYLISIHATIKRQCACSAPRLRPVGAAEVVHIADISKGKFTQDYQSAISLLVIDFTFLERWDGELVVKELEVVDSHSNRVSSYVFKRPCSWEEVPAFKARMNQAIDYGCNWNYGDILYSEL
jgi:hypothetical protein